MFEDEARQLEQLGEHPQIPQLLAYFEEENYLYLVQQYIQGKTLDKLYDRCWSEKEVRDFLNNILPVFQFIHSKKVIHRDIKPKNIMRRDDNGQYILIDFGASKDFAATVARRGTRIGTQGYAAYEQMQSGEAYNASDLFSLGATCFFLLTRVDPYDLLLNQGYQWVQQWPTHLQQPISDQVKQVLNKLLQKDRSDRYQSATEVLAALQTIAQQNQSQTPSSSSQTVAQQNQSQTPSSSSQTVAQQNQSQTSSSSSQTVAQQNQSQPQPQPIGQTWVQTPSQTQQQNRRKFLQYLGYGGIGVVTVGVLSLLRNRNLSLPFLKERVGRFPLETFSFETVKVDPQGNIIQRETKQGTQFSVDLGDDVFLDMVQIPGGTFMMGSPESEEGRRDNETQQQVTIDDFYMGTYQVTQEQWQAIMGNNPSRFDKGGKYPVENVSWDDCQEFCQKLSEKTGLTFTLPTEAQWEYACRAGTTTPFYYGETLSTDIANYNGNYVYGQGKKGVDRQETTEVGTFPANGFGLYDMHGNVWEWCQDDYHKNYQANKNLSQQATNKVTGNAVMLVSASFAPNILLANNPSDRKSLRGGSWVYSSLGCRSASRLNISRRVGHNLNIGVRVVCVFERTL